MRHLLLLYLTDRPEPGTPEGAAALAAVVAFNQQCRDRGVLLASEPLQHPASARTVRIRDGRTLRTDGPFAETKEWLAGYFLLDCDLDEALELAANCPTARTGSVEVRPILERSAKPGPSMSNQGRSS
jgi:hypothetical protein